MRPPAQRSDEPLTVHYSINSPLASHYRPATCEEIECPHWRDGWQVNATDLTDVHYVELARGGWHFTVLRVSEAETFLVFKAGQRCFEHGSHKVALQRPALYVVRDPARGSRRTHVRAEDWRDDLHEHTDQVARDRQRMG